MGRVSLGLKPFDDAIRRAVYQHCPALIFTLGRSKHTVLERVIRAALSCERARRDGPTKTARRLCSAPLYFQTKTNLSTLEMWYAVRRLNAELERKGRRLRCVIIEDIRRISGRSHREKLRDLTILADQERISVITAAENPRITNRARFSDEPNRTTA